LGVASPLNSSVNAKDGFCNHKHIGP